MGKEGYTEQAILSIGPVGGVVALPLCGLVIPPGIPRVLIHSLDREDSAVDLRAHVPGRERWCCHQLLSFALRSRAIVRYCGPHTGQSFMAPVWPSSLC